MAAMTCLSWSTHSPVMVITELSYCRLVTSMIWGMIMWEERTVREDLSCQVVQGVDQAWGLKIESMSSQSFSMKKRFLIEERREEEVRLGEVSLWFLTARRSYVICLYFSYFKGNVWDGYGLVCEEGSKRWGQSIEGGMCSSSVVLWCGFSMRSMIEERMLISLSWHLSPQYLIMYFFLLLSFSCCTWGIGYILRSWSWIDVSQMSPCMVFIKRDRKRMRRRVMKRQMGVGLGRRICWLRYIGALTVGALLIGQQQLLYNPRLELSSL